MEKGGGGEPATSAAGGMCDRFLTFLGKNLTMSRAKSIADGPKNGAAAGGHRPTEGGEEEGEEEDEFAIPIERAEFDYEFGGHGDVSAATVLEETAVATTTTARDVLAEQRAGAAADDGGPVAAPPAVAVEEEATKVRKTVTIKEDRPEQEAATLERKRSLFKKRQASASGAGGGDEQRVPRRSGLRPRMPPVLRVPSNINERSSTFIKERRRSFGGRGGKPAPDKQ